jgi:hypothetical protein
VEDDGGKREPLSTFLSAVEGTNTVRKCLMMSDVNDNAMAAHSNIENQVYRVQQKAKWLQLALIYM